MVRDIERLDETLHRRSAEPDAPGHAQIELPESRSAAGVSRFIYTPWYAADGTLLCFVSTKKVLPVFLHREMWMRPETQRPAREEFRS